MKIKNKQYIIWIIFILVLSSTISFFVPFITNNVSKHSKNALLSLKQKYGLENNGVSNYNNQMSDAIIKRLSNVVDYVNNSVITIQNKLKCSILGGKDDNGVNHKISELATFNNKSWIGKNRYSKETDATISNSVQKLKNEDKKINKIIDTIRNHPYTYDAYLNKAGLIIPNIDFFTNGKENRTNLKSSNIYKNLYLIGNTTPSLNSIVSGSEEATFGGEAISKSGMSLIKVVFTKIDFTAKIITFNTKLNEYQFATPTSIKDINATAKTTISNNNVSKTINSKFLKTTLFFNNNLFYLSSNRIGLSQLLSQNNSLLTNSNNVNGNSYLSRNFLSFNINFGIANINYNGVSQFKYNKLLYSLCIVYPLVIMPLLTYFLTGMSIGLIEIRSNKIKNVAIIPGTLVNDDQEQVQSIIDTDDEDTDDENSVHSDGDAGSIPIGNTTSTETDADIIQRINLAIENTLEDINQINNSLDTLKVLQSLTDKEPELIEFRNLANKVENNCSRISSHIYVQKENIIVKLHNVVDQLNTANSDLQDKLHKLNIRVAKERVKQRKEGLSENVASLDEEETIGAETGAFQRELQVLKWNKTADEYIDTLSLYEQEYFHDHAGLFLFNIKRYREEKEGFFNMVERFSNKLLPRYGYSTEDLSAEVMIIHMRYIDIKKCLSSAKKKILEKEDEFAALFSYTHGVEKRKIFSTIVNNNTRAINEFQREIKRLIHNLHIDDNDITSENIDGYNNHIQNKIDRLEIELVSRITTQTYKADIRKKIPEIRRIKDKWIEIKRNNILEKDSEVVDGETDSEIPNIRTNSPIQFNINDDLLLVFGKDI